MSRILSFILVTTTSLALGTASTPALGQENADDVSDLSSAREHCSTAAAAATPRCAALRAMELNGAAGTDSGLSINGSDPVESGKRARPKAAGEASAVTPVPFEKEPVREPLNEFQRFSASSLGETLPIFGANLFDKVPTTFAPLDRVPVTADYVIGPGDELVLRAWGQVNLSLNLAVDRVGAVYVPQVGNVSVTGLEFQQLPAYFRSQLARVFRNFDISVTMGQLRSVQVFVVGHARRPGAYTVSSLSTLVNAVFASGGPSASGSMRHIQLKRGTAVVTDFDLYDLLLNGDKSKDARLLPGDVVYIPPAGPQLAIAGSVKHPAIYELKGESTLTQVLRLCGGPVATADAHHATLQRIRDHSVGEVLDVSLGAESSHTIVQDGDILRVRAIVPRFEKIVTLRGNVANPGQFAWHSGMRVRDVIPDKDSLLTRAYWKKRNLLGFVGPDEMIARPPVDEANRKVPETKIDAGVPEINWSYAVVERRNARDLGPELLPFNLGQLVLQGDETQNLELRPGDVVTIFSQSDVRVSVSQQTRPVRLEGEFAAAGVYYAKPGETLGQLIQRAGGLTPQAYLFGSEFLRESTQKEQQQRLDQFIGQQEGELDRMAATRLGHALTPEEAANLGARLDSERKVLERLRGLKATGRIVLRLEPESNDIRTLMDLPLEAGDRFVVPPRLATINVIGAVYNQNAFLYHSPLAIKDYLQLAGGLTRTADKGRVMVIRADGSVLPTKQALRNSLHPGDSILVPETAFKGSFMRGLRDWSQIFAQFGLGAAAINILR